MVASVPRVRIRNRIGVDVPVLVVRVPVAVDRPIMYRPSSIVTADKIHCLAVFYLRHKSLLTDDTDSFHCF